MTNLQILIIDDNEADRFLIRTFLEQDAEYAQATIDEESSGLEGIKKIKGKTYDCVFLDYMLPDLKGIDILKKIYDNDSNLTPCPIVMLTGLSDMSAIIETLKHGAQDYIVKDNLSTETLKIAMTKARQSFDLKKQSNENKAKLLHSQKMEAVGRLSGGIAHDFNNLLTIMFGNLQLLEDMVNFDNINKSELQNRIENMKKSTERGADLIRRLMLFSRKDIIRKSVIDMNSLIDEIEELLNRTLGKHIKIIIEKGADLPLIETDPGQLHHAIINMGINARDAMPDGGDLLIKTSIIQIDQDQAKVLNIAKGSFVSIAIKDTGTGIKEEIREKIFSPFFTTKQAGHGTGLGLSMVYDFIKECGGTIELESKENHGTLFTLLIPASNKKTEESVTVDAPKLTRTEQKTILLVEDEDEIRNMASTILMESGYHVLQAENGDLGLALFKDNFDKIDLIVTDIMMPGVLDGQNMVNQINDINPNVKALFVSGYASEKVEQKIKNNNFKILRKPFKAEDLLENVSNVLKE